MTEWIKTGDMWHTVSGVIVDDYRLTTCGKRTQVSRQTLNLTPDNRPAGKVCHECVDPPVIDLTEVNEEVYPREETVDFLDEDKQYRVTNMYRYDIYPEPEIPSGVQTLIEGGTNVALVRVNFPEGKKVIIRYDGTVEEHNDQKQR